MQKLNRPMVKLNINSKMVSTVHRIQVTWVTAIMWLMCSLPTQKPVRKHSLLKTTLHCVKLLIAAIKNIYTYVFMGTFFLNICMICLLFLCWVSSFLLQTKINEILCLCVFVVVSSIDLIEGGLILKWFLLLTWILRLKGVNCLVMDGN